MEKIKYYISGKISGLPSSEYKERFDRAEAELRAKGYEVVNPTKNGLPATALWHEHIKADIRTLLDCDGVFMLDNWEKSNGAVLEHLIADSLGLIIEYEQEPKLPYNAVNIVFKALKEYLESVNEKDT